MTTAYSMLKPRTQTHPSQMAAKPEAATVAVILAVPAAAAVADCQRPGTAAVVCLSCLSGSSGDACGGDGGG